jgi:hypothetical protein
MGLESFSYISSLNASNPVHATDAVSQGDDHLRGLKTTLLNSFPNINAAVTFTPTEANRLTGLTGLTGSGNLVASASPTFTGTLTAAAIAATTYDGIAAANLVDKSAAETITGTWTFSSLVGGAMTATSYGGITEANLVDKSAAETISGGWTFSAAMQVATIEVGHATDTTLSRGAAGKLEVEGKPIIAHNDSALGSGEIHISTSAPSGGSDGDIWLEREA